MGVLENGVHVPPIILLNNPSSKSFVSQSNCTEADSKTINKLEVSVSMIVTGDTYYCATLGSMQLQLIMHGQKGDT